MTWETVRFETVKDTAVKNVKCSVCGKRLRRQRTFEQTINPYREDITPEMTRAETFKVVWKSVRAEAEAWRQQPETCNPCWELASQQERNAERRMS